MFAVFLLWPILSTVRYSFYDWDGFTTPTFNGLKNYARLIFEDELFRIALLNNLRLIPFYTLLPIAFALLLTVLLTHRPIKGMTLFRTGLFLPQVMAGVVVGVVWVWIYNPVFGPINQVLRAIGLGAWAKPWLGDLGTALAAVGIVAAWVQYGFAMVLFIAGVQQIDQFLYDAARVDGANVLRQFWHITLPGIRGEITFALVTTLVAALRLFDLVYVMSRGSGGPANRTLVVTLYLVRNAFNLNRTGYASAIAVIQTLIIGLITCGVIVLRRRLAEGV
jgi:raffinose/stachyose/melibiose transport system permease protein